MASISDPFRSLDLADLPPLAHYRARDGAQLAYRAYRPAAGASSGRIVLVHGSSASSVSMHAVAREFATAGFAVFALDMRGHGDSGDHGHIAYVGQLEDDLEDFVREVAIAAPRTLVGFSAGGGFALRFAGDTRQKIFDNYLLLAPFISQDAPSYRPDSGGWVRVGVVRYLAIALCNAVGLRAFNDLPVTRFALSEQGKKFLTAQYSYSLAENFRPLRDYRANIRAIGQPMRVLVGVEDEAFFADRVAGIFRAEGKEIPVTLLPGIGHATLVLDTNAIQFQISAVRAMEK